MAGNFVVSAFTNTMQVRDYEPSDRNACLEIFRSNLPLYFDPSELAFLQNWLDARDQGRIAYPANLFEKFYVLLAHGRIVACGGFYVPGLAKEAHMVWGMVDRSLHKKGYGKTLLLHRIQHIQQMHPGHSILLDTSQHTFPFFETLGFVVTRVTENSYGEGLHRYDMCLKTVEN